MATKANHRPPQIKPVGEDEKINLLVYAHPGVGKTSFIGTGPDKTLIIRPPTETLDPIKRANPNMSVWTVTSWNEMFEALEYLRDNQGDGWEWVWLDSVSSFQDTGLDDIWTDVLSEKPARARYGLDKAEYGVNMFRLGQWVRYMVGGRYFNFGMTAYPALLPNPDFEEESEDDDQNPEEILMPWIQGKNMSTKICGNCNIVAYLRIVGKGENKKRVLYTEPNAFYYAKNQLGPIPRGRLVAPTIPKLESLVLGEQKPTPRRKRRAS